jgi:hypothetical protein
VHRPNARLFPATLSSTPPTVRTCSRLSLVAIGVVVRAAPSSRPAIEKIREITAASTAGFDNQTEARDALRDELEQKELPVARSARSSTGSSRPTR